MFKLYAFGAIFLVLATVTGGLYYEWNSMKAEIVEQKALNAALDLKTKEQDKVIEQQANDFKLQNEIRDDLQVKLDQRQKQIEETENKFNKVSRLLGQRDIGKLAAARPEAIERIVNKGSINVVRCFEIASGKELTEEEKNAQKPSQLNTSCPNIANPNRITE